VQATFAARLPLEVLHHVGDVDLLAIDPRLLQRVVEELAGRSHEGMPLLVLLIAGLLADEHDLAPRRALAKHGLRGLGVERAGGAVGRLGLELQERSIDRLSFCFASK
jgi:hypothetical protein